MIESEIINFMKSSLRLKPKTPLEKDEIQKINTILMHLNNQPDSIDFRQPVDWQAMELYDYPDIIKNPMDLGTITRKFKQKMYKTVEAILNDIQIIWDNCKTYNSKQCEIYQIADKLELSFRKMIKNYLPHLKVSTVTSSPSNPVVEPPFQIVYMPDRGPKNIEISFEDKKKFVQTLKYLNQKNLEILLSQIEKTDPYCFNEIDGQWGKIDIKNIENSSFSQLNNSLQQIIKTQNVPPSSNN